MDSSVLSSQGKFKIVQTIESGEFVLSVVPTLWEEKGKLMWPPANETNNKIFLQTLPGTLDNGWQQFDCVVKRSGLESFVQARQEQNAMMLNSDTSSAEANKAIKQTTATTVRRTAAARKITLTIKNADADRSNYNDVNYI